MTPVDAQVSPSSLAVAVPCEVGSYRMADGTSLDIGPGAPGQLRWRLLDGRTGALTPQGNGRWLSTLGWTDRPDGHQTTISDCKRGAIRFDDVEGRRVGYQGGSQGGWVAPLAARIEPVDFVVVSFGLAVSPLDEDGEAIDFDKGSFRPQATEVRRYQAGDLETRQAQPGPSVRPGVMCPVG